MTDAVLVALFSGTTIPAVTGAIIGMINKAHIKDAKEETRQAKEETKAVSAKADVIQTLANGSITRLETKLAVTEKELAVVKDQIIILNRMVSKNDLDAAQRSRDQSETAALEVYQELVEVRSKLAALQAKQEAGKGGNPT